MQYKAGTNGQVYRDWEQRWGFRRGQGKKNISKMLHKIATEEENLLKSPNVDGGTPPLASEM